METGGACWDNWIEAIRRKEGNPEIRWQVDDGKTGEEGAAKREDGENKQTYRRRQETPSARDVWLPWQP